MALPKIDVPIYEVKLISTGNKVRFRPFTVKEEKLFLMANESEDFETTINTITQVLNNCVIDDIDVKSLPLFDIENLFLNLRGRSIGEVVNLRYKCNNKIKEENGEEHNCNNVVEIDLNVLDIQPTIDPAHKTKIEFSDNLGIVMKYPKMEMFTNKNEAEIGAVIDLIVDCIDYIYDKENIYYAKDSTKKELVDFIESLQGKDLEKLKDFFDTMPKLTKRVDFKCNKCGHQEVIELEGLQGFFG